MKKTILALLTLLFLTQFATAQKKYQGLLWEISGNGMQKPSYLYGTMHVSSKLAFHLGDSFFTALNNVDMVALEIHPETWVDDMLAYDPYTFSGEGFGNFGRRETNKNDERKGAVMKALRSDPSLINYYLFRSQGYTGNFEEDTYLDLYIFQAGKKLKKKTGGLENMADLMMNVEEAERAQKEESKYKERNYYYDEDALSYGDALEDAYRRGDLDALDSLNEVDGTPGYLEYMLYRRNQNMADRMDSIMRIAKLSLFAGMGASHLPGDKGVIEDLRRMGYTLRPVTRGERDTKQKRKIDNIVIAKKFETATSYDKYFSVDLPGKMYELTGFGNSRSYFHPDMANGAYYTITRIKTFGRELEQNADYILKSVDSLLYENIPGKIQKQKKNKVQGYDGYSITTLTRRGDIQRFQIVITPEEIFVFKLGGTGEFAQNKEADKFFNSIKLNIPTKTNWQTYTSPDGIFSALLPHTPLFYGDTTLLGTYLNQEPFTAIDFNNGNTYTISKKNIYQQTQVTFPDSLIMAKEMFDFAESKFYEELDRKTSNDGERIIIDARYAMEDGNHLQVRYITNRSFLYILSAKYKTDSADADRFVQSMVFTPTPTPVYEEYTDTLLHYTVTTTSQKNALEQLLRKISRYKEKDKGYRILHENKVFLEGPKSNEAVSVNYTRYGKYDRFKDSASFWDDVLNDINDDSSLIIINKKSYTKNGFDILDIEYTDTGCTYALKSRSMLRNAVFYSLTSIYNHKQGPSEFVTKFYETFTPKDTIIGQNIFSSNAQVILDDLHSSDSAARAEAHKSLRSVWVKKEDFKIWTAAIDTLQPENKDYFDYKAGMISELWYVKTPESVAYLKELYKKSGDTLSFQLATLKTLLNIETAESYKAFKELILSETPLGEAYEINSLFWSINDSVQLASGLFPDLLALFQLEEYKEKLVGALAELVDSNAVKTDAYKTFLPTLKVEAKNELKRETASQLEADGEYDKFNSYNSRRYYNPYLTDMETKYSRSNYSSYLGNLATLLLPFYKTDDAVKDFMDKALMLQNNKIRLGIALQMLEKGHNVPDTVWKEIAQKEGWRTALYDGLEEVKHLDKFPAQYINQDSITTLLIKNNIGSRYDKVDTCVLLSKRLVEFKEHKGYAYLYKYKSEKSKNWKLALVGLQPTDTNKINTSTLFFNTGTRLREEEQTPIEKQFTILIKEEIFDSEMPFNYRSYGRQSDYSEEYEYDDEYDY